MRRVDGLAKRKKGIPYQPWISARSHSVCDFLLWHFICVDRFFFFCVYLSHRQEILWQRWILWEKFDCQQCLLLNGRKNANLSRWVRYSVRNEIGLIKMFHVNETGTKYKHIKAEKISTIWIELFSFFFMAKRAHAWKIENTFDWISVGTVHIWHSEGKQRSRPLKQMENESLGQQVLWTYSFRRRRRFFFTFICFPIELVWHSVCISNMV